MTDGLLVGSDSGQAAGAAPAAGNPGTVSQVASTEAAGTVTAQSQFSWRDSLPEELRKEPSLATFADVATLAKSYVHANSLVGKKGVIPPGENASDAEMNHFYDSLGRPKLDKYELKGPDGVKLNDDVITKFKEEFHKLGILPKQASGILKAYVEYEKEVQSKQQSAKLAQDLAGIEALKKEWGEGFEKQQSMIRNFVKEVATPEETQELVKSGLANNVLLAKMFAKAAGKFMKEDSLRGESAGKFGLTPAEAQEKINEVMGNFENPYHVPNHPAHRDWVGKMESWFKAITPA